MKLRILFSLPLLVGALTLSATAADVHVKRLDGGGGSGGAAAGGGSISGGGGGGGGDFHGGGPVRVESHGGDRGFQSHDNFGGNRVRPDRVRSGMVRPRGAAADVGHTRIVRRSTVPTPQQHSLIASNPRVVRTIQSDRRVEVVPNHQYWHNVGGVRYVHYLRGGVHWYGFYAGPRFYWTRYYHNHWWWYDPFFDHWAFWWGGYWWWRGPEGVLYVNVNDTYYPYTEAPVRVVAPTASEPLTEDTENNGGEFTSRDGTRLVQIHGPQSEAFLYDKSGSQPQYLAYLGKNVDRVRFSGGTDGKPVRILVDFKNGDFTLFNAEGEPVDLTPPAEPATSAAPSAPSEPPSDVPELPGQ